MNGGQSKENGSTSALVIDIVARIVTWRGTPIVLTRLEFDLLAMLARHPDSVLEFSDLTEAVWRRQYLGDSDSIRSTVKRLRCKLRAVGADVEVISVRGIGLKLLIEPRSDAHLRKANTQRNDRRRLVGTPIEGAAGQASVNVDI